MEGNALSHRGIKDGDLLIARHITGAHWSAPRFFGLKRTSRAGSSDA